MANYMPLIITLTEERRDLGRIRPPGLAIRISGHF